MFSSELWQAPSAGGYTPTTKGIFAFGNTGSVTAISNLVSSSGVVASDTAGVGSVEKTRCGATYGIDKAFFWGGEFASI